MTRVQSLIRELKDQRRIAYEREQREHEARRTGVPVVDEHAERIRVLASDVEQLEARKLLGEVPDDVLRAKRAELEAARTETARGTPLAIARVETALREAKARAIAETTRQEAPIVEDAIARYREKYREAEQHRLAQLTALGCCDDIANELRVLLGASVLHRLPDVRAEVRTELGITPAPKPVRVRYSPELPRVCQETKQLLAAKPDVPPDERTLVQRARARVHSWIGGGQ